MPGRPLRDEATLNAMGYDHPDFQRRRQVLRETLARLERRGDEDRALARQNHERWAAAPAESPGPGAVQVVAGDWGAVALDMSRRTGRIFAVLNMANAYTPGGAYIEGTAAQEENLFRRTDCHFAVRDADTVEGGDRYTAEKTALLKGRSGRVYLDLERPRICLRGPEDRAADDLGYRWLGDDELFLFYELRAAAVDLRRGRPFDRDEMRRRIEAQLDTLVDGGVRAAVLSAFGCGAFRNPASEVARLYRAALAARRDDFDLVTFAIFNAGYGPDNFTPFQNAFADWPA